VIYTYVEHILRGRQQLSLPVNYRTALASCTVLPA